MVRALGSASDRADRYRAFDVREERYLDRKFGEALKQPPIIKLIRQLTCLTSMGLIGLGEVPDDAGIGAGEEAIARGR